MLRVREVRVHARGRALVELDGLEVASGEMVALLGPNGAGKSTLMQVIAGLVTPSHGRVELGGMALQGALYERARAGLGYLHQQGGVFARLSVTDNLRLVDGADVSTALRMFALEALAGQRAGTLSGGERRRLELARLWCIHPKAWVLDEPLAGIDPLGRGRILEQLHQLRQAGAAILVSDHAASALLPKCDRAVIMVQGRALFSGSPAEVARHPEVRERYLGHDFCLE